MKPRLYVLDNIDGSHDAMVLASNLREACRLIGTSEYQARQFGWDHGDAFERVVANGQPPGTVFIRKTGPHRGTASERARAFAPKVVRR